MPITRNMHGASIPRYSYTILRPFHDTCTSACAFPTLLSTRTFIPRSSYSSWKACKADCTDPDCSILPYQFAGLVTDMQPKHERRFFLDMVEDSLNKVLPTRVPSWFRARQRQQSILSVDDVECAISAMRAITARINAFAFKEVFLTRKLADTAGCTLAWGCFELLEESRRADIQILENYMERRTSRRWHRTIPPTDMSSVLVAFQRIRDDVIELTTMLASLEVKRSVQQDQNRTTFEYCSDSLRSHRLNTAQSGSSEKISSTILETQNDILHAV